MKVLSLVLFALAPTELPPQHIHDVHVDAALRFFEVRACFADGLPERLIADHPLAAKATREFRYRIANADVVKPVTGRIAAFDVPSDDGCVEWQVDLDAIAGAQRLNIGYRTKRSIVLAPSTWLWRPPHLSANREFIIRFHLPEGMQLSVPWEPLFSAAENVAVYRRDHSPLDWPALMAIGDLQTATIIVPGAVLQLAVADGPADMKQQRVEEWLVPAAHSVSMLWGRFPVPRVQLLAIPVHDGYDAAPWAQTSRGGGAAAHFYVNAAAPADVFRDDWIATHELAHFSLPFIRRRDAWLSEGFASYYQYVLRARSGRMSEHDAWAALHEGFMRGHRDTEYDTLQEDTAYMHTRGRVMRVYWSGAAIALLADVKLRSVSGGEWTLDRVLEEFHRCCRRPERTWNAREVFAKFDEISGTQIFDHLYRTTVYSRHFPRLAETWEHLGIDTTASSVRLLEIAPGVAIRDGIMRPRDKNLSPETTTPGERSPGAFRETVE